MNTIFIYDFNLFSLILYKNVLITAQSWQSKRQNTTIQEHSCVHANIVLGQTSLDTLLFYVGTVSLICSTQFFKWNTQCLQILFQNQ